MHINSSEKDQKLLQLHSRLSRMNKQTFSSEQHKKLCDIYAKNKQVQTQISNIFDSISQHFFKSEQRVKSISKEIISHVSNIQQKLLKQLGQLKEKQLQNLKEQIDGYMKTKKKIKKLMQNFENNKNQDQIIKSSTQKIIPFSTKGIKDKISHCQQEISEIQTNIEKFAKIIPCIDLNYNKKKHQKMNFLNLSKSNVSQDFSNEEIFQEQKNFFGIQQQMHKFYQPKKSECEQNLMDGEDFDPKSPISTKNKTIKNQLKIEDQQMDHKTQKLTTQSQNIERIKSYDKIHKVNNNFSLNVKHFLGQLRRSQKIKLQCENAQTFEQNNSNKNGSKLFSNLSRVKSEQNLAVRRVEVPSSRISTNLSGSKAKLMCSMSSLVSQNKLKDFKSSSKGNWSKILRDQQLRYNEMKTGLVA